MKGRGRREGGQRGGGWMDGGVKGGMDRWGLGSWREACYILPLIHRRAHQRKSDIYGSADREQEVVT